jgi:hypothetical protein
MQSSKILLSSLFACLLAALVHETEAGKDVGLFGGGLGELVGAAIIGAALG